MVQVHPIETNTLSTFRTRHRILHYAEFTTVQEFLSCCNWARDHKVRLYILGNGSNTLFSSRIVRTLVLRNKLEPRLRDMDSGRMEASSSLPIMALLRHCHELGLDSFYYLAAAPATIGGAIAMNAGRGRSYNMTVYDYLESVSYLEGETIVTVPAGNIERSYRWTQFTGLTERLIVSAVFQFGRGSYEGDPIADRLAYVKKTQDLSAANCGSVFRECHDGLQNGLRGLRVGTACFSGKAPNWILNYGNSPWPIRTLIRISKMIHWLMRRKAVLELVEVP